jgi:hypothetical protein
MKASIFQLKGQIALFLAIALTVPLDAVAASATAPQPPGSYPDSPGALWAQSNEPQSVAPQSVSSDQQNATTPVGTAVAPYVKPEGVTASRPSGAAIAPAKQKREHSLALRVGLVVGAAVAVGTVVALSSSSSSHPH